jgi:hypothetical protein
LFFLCFASVQNCETYPPARRKNKQALKNKVGSACCMDVKCNNNFIYFFFCKRNTQQSVKLKDNDSINEEYYKTFAITTQLNENFIEKRFYRDFLLFVFQLLWFKTYPHADAKQRKTKKWP